SGRGTGDPGRGDGAGDAFLPLPTPRHRRAAERTHRDRPAPDRRSRQRPKPARARPVRPRCAGGRAVTCGCGGPPAECCCDVRVPQPPLTVDNRPGLPALRRRVATHATAKSTMLHALSQPELPGTAELTSRTDEDFAIALLDGAASVVDLLTTYTERFV